MIAHLHVDGDAAVDAGVLQRADHLQAGAVADVGEARVLVAAEVPLEDAAVVGAVEQGAPALQLADALGGFLGVQLGHPPVVQVLAAAHGVGEVDPPVVAVVDVGQRRGDAALGHDRVGLAEQRLADEPDLDAASADASMAARSPAPPAPITSTSYAIVLGRRHQTILQQDQPNQ